MADEATAPDEAAEQKKSSGMMKTMMMAVGIFIIVLAAQTVAPLISSKLGLTPQVAIQGDAAEEEAGNDASAAGPPIYWPLKPAMVVNFSGTGDSSFLQVEMEVMARDQFVIDQVKEHTPALRNSLLLLLASQTDDVVFTTEGKQALLGEALLSINEVLEPYVDDTGVEAVYFTSFVAQ